jgi:ABC-2 type transport system ATP-binding protein
MDVVQKYCNRTAFMKNGSLVYFGDTEKAVQMYIDDNH